MPTKDTGPADVGLTDERVTVQEAAPVEVEEVVRVAAQSLQSLHNTQLEIHTIRQNLAKVIEAIDYNPSLISRWANAWGGMSLVAKITSGTIIVAPLLIAGLAASIPGLLYAGGATAAAYTGAGAILEDHHLHSQTNTIKIKEGVMGLVDLLGALITVLEKIRGDLTREVDRFEHENKRLADSVTALKDQVISLSTQVETFQTEIIELQQVKVALTEQVAQGGELLAQYQEELQAVNERYQKATEGLETAQAELISARAEYDKQMKGAHRMTHVLQTTVSQMVATQWASAEEKDKFEQRLQAFIDNKESTFERLAKHTLEAEKKLHEVEQKLEARELEYARLNARHEAVVARLEGVMQTPIVTAIESTAFGSAGLVANHGLFASKPREDAPREEAWMVEDNAHKAAGLVCA